MKNKFLYILIFFFITQISNSQTKKDSLKISKLDQTLIENYEKKLAVEFRKKLIFEKLYRNVLYYKIREIDYIKLNNSTLNKSIYYDLNLEDDFFLSIPLIGDGFYFDIIDTRKDYIIPLYRIYAVKRIKEKDYRLKYSVENCILKQDTLVGHHQTSTTSSDEYPIVYIAVDSTQFFAPEDAVIYYLSGENIYLSAISSHFKLDKTKPETYYEFLKFKTLSYNVKSTFKYETTAKGKIVFTADADKDLQYVFLVDEKFPDDIMVKYILKKNKK